MFFFLNLKFSSVLCAFLRCAGSGFLGDLLRLGATLMGLGQGSQKKPREGLLQLLFFYN